MERILKLLFLYLFAETEDTVVNVCQEVTLLGHSHTLV